MTDTKPNPANSPAKPERKRIPMSVPQRKLEVNPIPGYHTHWFREDNIERAIQAGYEFVDAKEVEVNQFNPGTSKDISGNADLGSRVRVVSGMGLQGPEYLTLMKVKEEWYNQDKETLEKRNADVMSAIFKGEQILGSDKQSAEDRRQAYVKQADANLPLFNRRPRKSG